jgi:hypothetical protein
VYFPAGAGVVFSHGGPVSFTLSTRT